MASADDIECVLKATLYTLPPDDLVKVLKYLGFDETEDLEGRSKLELIKLTEQYLDNKSKKQDDCGMAMFQDVIKEMENIQFAKKGEDIGQDANVKLNIPPPTCVPYSFRKEFKISGQIGLAGQKDKLSFTSLSHRIEAGVKRGYIEEDIVEAVIRSITPGLHMRSYLEGKQVSLAALRGILRSHFLEKSPTELFQQLSGAVQGNKEDPTTFLIRVLDLKQKVLFASQEAHSNVAYDERLVGAMCRRALLTGLHSDLIRQQLQPMLERETTDEELIQQMGVSMSSETEKDSKLSRRNVKVSEMSCTTPDMPENTKKEPVNGGGLKLEVQELKDKLTVLTEKLESLVLKSTKRPTAPQPSPGRNRARLRLCPSCRDLGGENPCTHCFGCGSDEHYYAYCPQRNQGGASNQSGNARGSQWRGAQ